MEQEFDIARIADPEYFAEGCLPAHSDHSYFATAKEAEKGKSSYIRSLDGKWKFFYAENQASVPEGFQKPGFDVHAWDEIRVPGHLQTQGYDAPMYVNTQYPWDGHEEINPGMVPEKFNPIGCYVKDILLPAFPRGRRAGLCLEGAESGAAVWCNGHYIGYCTDSFTPHSFELTSCLTEGTNRIAVMVIKWTAASWCEDQDFFRFSGLFRPVSLFVIPEEHVYDLKAVPELTDDFRTGKVHVELYGCGEGKAAVGIVPYFPEEGKGKGRNPKVLASAEVCFSGKSSLSEAMEQPAASADLLLPNPLLWSAECPNLYALKVTLKEETVIYPFGFRRIEIRDGILLINGRRIVFKGVDRHEFSALGGRAVTEEETLTDILTMKRNNINAIRTSHYPNSSYLYQLCDRFGIYLIAENNMETHGTWEAMERGIPNAGKYLLPGDNPKWQPMMVDRINSCYQKDKNHASVLIWSLGNESFGGKVILAMSKKIRELDPLRPVHYEGIYWDPRYPETTDFESQMYPPVERIRATLEKNRKNGCVKPFICCEYAHAMGNSNGALHKYTELADTEPNYQGGFIWDYIDQSMTKKDRYGKTFQAYGGDFGDRPNDGDFSGNGIVYAEKRDPSPKMQEVKYCYQNIEAQVSGKEVLVINKNLFLPTSAYDCIVILSRDGNETARQMLKTDAAPLSEKRYRLPFGAQKEPGEYTVTVSFVLKEKTSWAEKGHEVAFGQYVYRIEDKKKGEKKPAYPEEFTVVRGRQNLGVQGRDWEILFSEKASGMISYLHQGRQMIARPPMPDFWRAPTDNDRGNHMAFRHSFWKTASLYSADLKRQPDRIRVKENAVSVSWKYSLPAKNPQDCLMEYTVYPDGTVRVRMTLQLPEEAGDPPLFGVSFKMDADYDRLKWYGLGPEETYCDRCRGAKLGIYETTARKSMAKYLIPQETGNRTGVRWAEVTGEDGHGLRFEGSNMEFSILPYTSHELENALHANELPEVHYTVVRAALGQMGVGGDNSWGAETHPEYHLPSGKKLTFTFAMKAI